MGNLSQTVWKRSAPFKPTSSNIRTSSEVRSGWQSGNWSGYAIKKTKRNSFHTISGYWIVPRVKAGRTVAYSSAWIGIDGFRNRSLIQTGTEQDYERGKPVYYAWWEILPAPETIIRFPVSPGNLMYARISRLRKNKWMILLRNKTKGWTFKRVTTYKGPAASAEWIVEAPSINGKTTRLANYGKMRFSKCRLNRKNALLKTEHRGVMIQNNRVVSTPSLPNKSKNGFTVAYGSAASSTAKYVRRKHLPRHK
ncbi:G1 family glutamic endopeptidase [Paenibacillus thermotolerans]|uniref:G1 family glutamic endopeptidase n=1 Tax=Paenibacillus thermotolerans TaxID=3027807 RepID=UPI002368613F|nr:MULTISPECIES: G1 family glutamic endopeptidase [unclassified Paenibacillus]